MKLREHYGSTEEVFKILKGAEPAPRIKEKTLEDYRNEILPPESVEEKRRRWRLMKECSMVRERGEQI